MTADDDAAPDLDPEVEAALARQRARPWPGPDRYTLLAWVELDLALERGVRIDAAHALLSDAVAHAFGHRLFEWVSGALTAEGRDPDDLTVLLDDDALTERVLSHVHARMGEDDEAPEPPLSEEFGWYAYSPDDPGGTRERYRRAVRERKQKARRALVDRPPRRVAGPRDR